MHPTSKPEKVSGTEREMSPETESRYRRLRCVLKDYGSVLVAYSGGVDSGLLAWVANDVLAERALAVLAGSFFCLLVFISPQKVADDAIAVGERLREFTAQDANGEVFSMSSVAGKPVLLKFFRGHW